MTWRLTRGAAVTGGRGNANGEEYSFLNCTVGDVTLDGTFQSLDSNGSLQAQLGSLGTREYDIEVRQTGRRLLQATGETEDRFSRDGTAPCNSGVSSSSFARFGTAISINDDRLGATVESLSTSTMLDTNVLRFARIPPDCLTETAVMHVDTAIFVDEESGVTLEVSRQGVARFRTAEAAAEGEVATASLEIRSLGDPNTQLRLVSLPATSDTALLVIEENGSVISFETSWSFGR